MTGIVGWAIGLPFEIVGALWVGWASHIPLDALSGGCHCGGRGITVLSLACDWRRGEMRVLRITSTARVV